MASDKLFDKAFITELKDRTNIVDLIGRYEPLKKRGHTYTCCCPFHDEKTPSFVVDEKENKFKCFGGSCGESGDPISFLEKHQSLNFVEAVRELCHFNGITPPENDQDSKAQNEARKHYFNFTRRLTHHLQSELQTEKGALIGSKLPITESFKEGLKLGTLIDQSRLKKILNGASMQKEHETLKSIGVLSEQGTLNLPANGVYLPVTSRRGSVLGFSYVDGALRHHVLPESDLYRPDDELINISNVHHNEPCYFAFNFKSAVQANRHFQSDNILITPLDNCMLSEQQLIKANRVANDLTFLIPTDTQPRHTALASLLVNYQVGDELKILDLKTGASEHLLDFMDKRWSAFPDSLKDFYTGILEDTQAEILLDVLEPETKKRAYEPSPA